MGSSRVERNGATLAAIMSVGRPCSLVPSVFETLSDLRKRAGKCREGNERNLAEQRREQYLVGREGKCK